MRALSRHYTDKEGVEVSTRCNRALCDHVYSKPDVLRSVAARFARLTVQPNARGIWLLSFDLGRLEQQYAQLCGGGALDEVFADAARSPAGCVHLCAFLSYEEDKWARHIDRILQDCEQEMRLAFHRYDTACQLVVRTEYAYNERSVRGHLAMVTAFLPVPTSAAEVTRLAAEACSVLSERELALVERHARDPDSARAALDGVDARCAHCNVALPTTKPPPRCSRCGLSFYCNDACQRADWRRHKPGCGILAAMARSMHRHLEKK
jgi:hypothetical protein